MPNANFHNAGIKSADTIATLDSNVVHTLPADTMTTLDSDAVHTLPVEKCYLEGSRLFNLQILYNIIKTISEHSVKCGAVVEFIGEVQRNGLASRLLAACSRCNEEILISACNKVVLYNHDGKERPTWAYNVAAVMGQMATGGGHSSLEEMLSTLGVPSLAKRMFTEIEQCLGTSFEQLLLELMVKTGKEEKQMAEQNNDYSSCSWWLEQTVTQTFLQYQFRCWCNLWCCHQETTVHWDQKHVLCCLLHCTKIKNWSGSSTAMEADIIAAGFFRQSEAMHGVRYIKVIGDGDSSVLHTILITIPYGRYVSKLECANHCVNCYCSHLEQMVKDFPHFKGRGNLSKRTIIKLHMEHAVPSTKGHKIDVKTLDQDSR